MKTLKNRLSVLLILAIVAIAFSACEKDAEEYEVRLSNNAYSEALGLVPTKFVITKFTIGDVTLEENIDYGGFSDYFIVESDKEYQLYIEYDQYLYNMEIDGWQFDNSFSDTMGPEEWYKDECNPQRITITIKSLLGVAVGADYTVYCDQ